MVALKTGNINTVFNILNADRSSYLYRIAVIKAKKLGTLVGTKTAGEFMAGAAFKLLNNRFFLYLAVREFNPPDIPKIEGVGVEPDFEVADCARFCQGKEPSI